MAAGAARYAPPLHVEDDSDEQDEDGIGDDPTSDDSSDGCDDFAEDTNEFEGLVSVVNAAADEIARGSASGLPSLRELSATEMGRKTSIRHQDLDAEMAKQGVNQMLPVFQSVREAARFEDDTCGLVVFLERVVPALRARLDVGLRAQSHPTTTVGEVWQFVAMIISLHAWGLTPELFYKALFKCMLTQQQFLTHVRFSTMLRALKKVPKRRQLATAPMAVGQAAEA